MIASLNSTCYAISSSIFSFLYEIELQEENDFVVFVKTMSVNSLESFDGHG